MKLVLFSTVLVFSIVASVEGQINSKAIERIQKWVDSTKGRREYKKAGEIVLPKLTKSTKFGWLEFSEKWEDKGRRYYWKAKQSDTDVKMVGYQNWRTKKIWKVFRINGVDVPRVVDIKDIPGEYETGDVHRIRNASASRIRNALESNIYFVVRSDPPEYKAIGSWQDIKQRLRPPKSKEQIEEEKKKRMLEREAKENKKKAGGKKPKNDTPSKVPVTEIIMIENGVGNIEIGETTFSELRIAIGEDFVKHADSNLVSWYAENEDSKERTELRVKFINGVVSEYDLFEPDQ